MPLCASTYDVPMPPLKDNKRQHTVLQYMPLQAVSEIEADNAREEKISSVRTSYESGCSVCVYSMLQDSCDSLG